MILERNEAEDKIRTLREEVLKKERRLHEDIKIRSDDIDRQSYNQRDRFKTLSLVSNLTIFFAQFRCIGR